MISNVIVDDLAWWTVIPLSLLFCELMISVIVDDLAWWTILLMRLILENKVCFVSYYAAQQIVNVNVNVNGSVNINVIVSVSIADLYCA